MKKSIENDLKSNNFNNRIRGLVDLVEYVAYNEEWYGIEVYYYGNSYLVKDAAGERVNITLKDNTYEKINNKIKKHYGLI